MVIMFFAVSNENILYKLLIKLLIFNKSSISDVIFRAMGSFKIQLLLSNITWSTLYNIPKNDQYSDSSTDWTFVSLSFFVETFAIKLFYDQIDRVHADMCFSSITRTHSLY